MAENQSVRQWSCAILLTDGTWNYQCIYCKKFIEGEKQLREHVSSFHEVKDQTERSEKRDVAPEAGVSKEGETETGVTQANYESFAETSEETESSDRVKDCKSLPEVTNYDESGSDKSKDKSESDPSSSKENTPTSQTHLKLDYNRKTTQPAEKNECVDAVAFNGKSMSTTPTAPEVTHLVRNRLHDCKTCRKSFTQSSSLKIHERTHSGERPYICKFCNKSFTQMQHLKRHERTHERIHNGVKLFTCKICNKSFSLRSVLKCHERTHTGEKPCICQTCNKSFTSNVGLWFHKATHNSEKLHICRFCEKGFHRNWTLKRHERIHTGDRPHECNVCGKKFGEKKSLIKHFAKCGERSEVKNY